MKGEYRYFPCGVDSDGNQVWAPYFVPQEMLDDKENKTPVEQS